jgi:hypothetical protein
LKIKLVCAANQSALWTDLSKTFYNLGNIIVGFSTLQALAFVYSFYGAPITRNL